MTIAVISHWGFKSLHGGNLRAYFFIQELLAQGHHIIIVLADDADVDHCQKLFGCRAVSVHEPMSRWQSARKKMFQYLVFGYKVRQYLKTEEVDAIFGINLIQALPAVAQSKAESWVMYVDLWADFFEYDAPQTFFNRVIVRCVRFAEFYTMRKADKLVMITDAMRTLIPQKIQPRVKVIPDGADTRMFKPGLDGSEIRTRYNLAKSPVFSYQGGIARHEGLDLLCEAAPYVLEQLPEARFLIVGRGDFLDYCKNLVEQNGSAPAFVFTGWINYSEMPRILAAVDISVVPMPNVRAARPIISFKLLEAMASDTLVVANQLPGLSEIVDEHMVIMTEADNPKIFARDLVRAYKLPELAKRIMRDQALKKIRSLDWREVAKRDVQYFTDGRQ